ncbi:MAG: DUF1700 domain-containing protein [Coriobacteriales bacterium]|jgi:uncharacterized membrane protein|nr:DUF1700 domain-containing protein [Coriobacteriales bacterium]
MTASAAQEFNNFLGSLEKQLKGLPPDERAEVLAYYREYLDDSLDEHGDAQAAVASVGSAREIAARVRAQMALEDFERAPSPRKGARTVWLVVLAVFASPFAFTAVMILVTLAFALLLVLVSVILSVAVTSIAFLVTGVLATAMAFYVAFCLLFSTPSAFGDLLYFNPLDVFFMLGTGFASLGLGGLLAVATAYMTKGSCWALVALSRKILKRGAQ